MIVECDACQRVKSFKDQFNILLPEYLLGDLKLHFILPVLVCNPKHLIVVHANVWVRYHIQVS